MLLSAESIRKQCSSVVPLIDPFVEGRVEGVISYGLTHAGYDLRLAGEALMFKPSYGLIVDPKRFADEEYRRKMFDTVEASDGKIVVPPHSYCLVRSVERFQLPLDLKGRCVGKSTYARCGIIVNCTPLEPGWGGYLTIELANTNPCPVALYVSEGIAQVEFEQLDHIGEGYGSKKYQHQGPTPEPPR